MSKSSVPIGFEWSDYLKLANKLHLCSSKSELKEAFLRTAISRAYYAAYCLAKNYISKIETNIVSNNVSAHAEVQAFFKNDKTNRTHLKVGTKLERLRKNRNKADYAYKMSEIEKTTLFSIEEAQFILDFLNNNTN